MGEIIIFIILLLTVLFVRITYTDLRYRKIRNEEILGIVFLAIISEIISPRVSWNERFLGIFCVSVPLMMLVFMVPGSIGGGDIKLMAGIGFLMGAHLVWQCFYTGILIAAIYVLIQLVRKKMTRKSSFALGPFLISGTLITIFIQFMIR